MKINLMVRRGDAFHVDGLDLLSARARAAFVAEAANELDLPPDAVKRDIGQVLLALEAVQEEMLRVSAPAASGPAMSAADEAAALAWLRAPDLLARIATDIAACGVIGEAGKRAHHLSGGGQPQARSPAGGAETALMRRAVEHLAAEKADITIPDYTVTLGRYRSVWARHIRRWRSSPPNQRWN